MNTQDIIALEDTYQLPTYKKMPIALERGDGCRVWDTDGNAYYDFYGGHCVALLGHSPKAVVRAVQEQAERLLFYSNVVYSPVRARAAAALARMAPDGLRHAFFCNSGTEANETALKLARMFTGRSAILAMEHDFHGRTLGSLATTWGSYREPYRDVLPETVFAPFADADAVERILEERDDVAGIILEPIQSMAGIREADPAYYRTLRRLCDAHGVVLIFDEVQTGVGRTGAFSISDHYGMRPDLITLAKSLGAGVPVGAVLASDAIAETVNYGDQGTTFGGGMLAMAAVEATLQTLQDDDLLDRAAVIFERVRTGLAPLVHEVRGRGCLIGVDLGRPARPVIDALREAGFLTGGSGDPHTIRLMPPLNTPDDALDALIEAFEHALAAQPQG